MKLIDKIQPLIDEGLINDLTKIGIVNHNLIYWIEIYRGYEIELNKSGSKMMAMQTVADRFRVSFGMVRHIRREMSRSIDNK